MIIVFDIGASKMRVAQYADGVLQVPLRRSTPVSFAEGYPLLVSLIRTACADGTCTHIIGGVRGVLAEDASRIAHDDLLPNWARKPLAHLLREEFGAPVTLAPSVLLAARGEHVYGAARGMASLAHISVGASVAAASIAHDGVGAVHYGGMHEDDVVHTLSELIGGAAFAKRHGVTPDMVPAAHEAWRAAAEYLAHGIAGLAHHVRPEAVILSGSMITGTPRIPLTETIHAAHKLLGAEACPIIIPSSLGDDATLYGAVAASLYGNP